MSSDVLSVADAAERLGVSPRRVRQLIDDGDLRASRMGRSWLVAADSVERRRRLAPSGGRPLDSQRVWVVALVADDMVHALRRRLEAGPEPNDARSAELAANLSGPLALLRRLDLADVVHDDAVREQAEAALHQALSAIQRNQRLQQVPRPRLLDVLAREQPAENDARRRDAEDLFQKMGEDRADAERAAVRRLRNALVHGREASPQDIAVLRSRAEGLVGFHAHPSLVRALFDDELVVRSGAHAAAEYGVDIVPGDRVDFYLNASAMSEVVERYALEESPPSEANVWIRPVGDLHLKACRAPRLLVAADLLEHEGSRERSAALELLNLVQSAIAWHEALS